MKTTTLFTIIASLMVSMACMAQQKQTVNGTISGAQKVYCTAYLGKIDSTEVVNGKFSFEIQPASPGEIYTVSNTLERDENAIRIFFAADGTEVSVDMDTKTINGTGVNSNINTYNKRSAEIEKEYTDLYAQVQNAPEAEVEAMKEKLNEIYNRYMKYTIETYEQNDDNLFGAYLLASQLAYAMDAAELEEAVGKLAYLGDNALLMQPKQMLANLAKRKVGNKFIDFEMADTEGNMHKLSDWCGKGQYVLIDFWASWCGPCCREMPNVVANYKKYHDKGFEIIGISFDRSKDAWLKKIDELGLNWIHLSDLKFWQCIASSLYGIQSIPANTLVGPDGTIIANDLREDALGAKLSEIFGE